MNLVVIATTINLDLVACLIPLAVVTIPLAWLLLDEALTRSDLDNTQEIMLQLMARQQRNHSCISTLGVAFVFFLLAGAAVLLFALFAHRAP